MCGLCGYVEREPLDRDKRERLTDALLVGVDHRGGDATGLLAIPHEGAPWLLKAPLAAGTVHEGAAGSPGRDPGADRAYALGYAGRPRMGP